MGKSLKILLANPRGFCAGVGRAISIVEKALEKYGAPVYVRHEIVHNSYVLDKLRRKGAIFVESLDEVPEDVPVIFSAHGVAKSVPKKASAKNMTFIDATCPLVSKVHKEVEKYFKNNQHIILIGHRGHPEVIGTMGQLPKGEITLIETVEDAKNLTIKAPDKLAYATQTTLSIDDAKDIVAILKKRFPSIKSPPKEDICYATTNRQNAVKMIAPKCDYVVIVGSNNSSNANRLVEVAKKYGCLQAYLAADEQKINWDIIKDEVSVLGISAGASTPEFLIDKIIQKAKKIFDSLEVEEISITKENMSFKLPKIK